MNLSIPEFEGDPLEVKRMKFLYGLLLAGVLNVDFLIERRKQDPMARGKPGTHYGAWSEIELAHELECSGLCSSNLMEITWKLIHKMEKQRPEVVSRWYPEVGGDSREWTIKLIR